MNTVANREEAAESMPGPREEATASAVTGNGVSDPATQASPTTAQGTRERASASPAGTGISDLVKKTNLNEIEEKEEGELEEEEGNAMAEEEGEETRGPNNGMEEDLIITPDKEGKEQEKEKETETGPSNPNRGPPPSNQRREYDGYASNFDSLSISSTMSSTSTLSSRKRRSHRGSGKGRKEKYKNMTEEEKRQEKARKREERWNKMNEDDGPVSYTHLTLPTIYSV